MTVIGMRVIFNLTSIIVVIYFINKELIKRRRHVFVQGCAGLHGTNRRRSNRSFPSKRFSNLPTMIPLLILPPCTTILMRLNLKWVSFLLLVLVLLLLPRLFLPHTKHVINRYAVADCRPIWLNLRLRSLLLKNRLFTPSTTFRNLPLLGKNLRRLMTPTPTPTLLAPGLFSFFLSLFMIF